VTVARRLPLLAFGALACSGQEYDYVEYEQVDVFYQYAAEQVDILLVVDDSGSMAPYQERLGANFEAFLTYFWDAMVDYQIGIVTTDVFTDTPGTIHGEIITADTINAAVVFNDTVNVGTEGTGLEMGMESARLALLSAAGGGDNSGFLREDAYLSVIFVTDEDDASPLSMSTYVKEYRALKANRRDALHASALVVTELENCDPDVQDDSSMGARYIGAAEASGGIVRDICSEDFETIIADLSLNTSRLRDTFYLAEPPDTETLVVTVDETEVPCDDGTWTYTLTEHLGAETGAIVFDSTNMPPLSSKITVRYNVGTGDAERFCAGETAE